MRATETSSGHHLQAVVRTVGVNSVEFCTPIMENALQDVGIPDQIKALICDTFQVV
jgi:hypothetical protein